MIDRQILILRIIDNFAVLMNTIELSNSLKFFDINRLAEDVIAEILNIVNDLTLINLNTVAPNAPYVDLADQKNKLMVQVTSDGSSAKVVKTLEGFETKYLKQYDTILIFLLKGKKPAIKKDLIPKSVQFNPESDILTFKDLVNQISRLNLDKLKLIEAYTTKEFGDFSKTARLSQKDAVDGLQAMFNRPAMLDAFEREHSMDDFSRAITELIEFLKTGRSGTHIGLKMTEFLDAEIRDILDSVFHKLMALRELYISSVQSGQIRPGARDYMHFKSDSIPQAFNNIRGDLMTDLNRIFKAHGVAEIRLKYRYFT